MEENVGTPTLEAAVAEAASAAFGSQIETPPAAEPTPVAAPPETTEPAQPEEAEAKPWSVDDLFTPTEAAPEPEAEEQIPESWKDMWRASKKAGIENPWEYLQGKAPEAEADVPDADEPAVPYPIDYINDDVETIKAKTLANEQYAERENRIAEMERKLAAYDQERAEYQRVRAEAEFASNYAKAKASLEAVPETNRDMALQFVLQEAVRRNQPFESWEAATAAAGKYWTGLRDVIITQYLRERGQAPAPVPPGHQAGLPMQGTATSPGSWDEAAEMVRAADFGS